MMSGITATTALDIALPAPVAVDELEEVVLTPVPTDSNMIDPVKSLMGPEDDKYIPDCAISPAEDEIMGLGALVNAELGNGNALDRDNGDTSVQDSQEIPLFSQETMGEDKTPPSSAISSHNLSQTLPHSSQAPTSEPKQLRGGQLVPEVPSTNKSLLQPITTAGQKRTADGYIRRSSSSSSSRSSTPQNGTSTPLKDGPDPKRHNKHGGHTRNVSAISAASSAMSPRELTNELKTRLSYAMVKVQKGWESLPIYDLESMASQSGSPSSSSGPTLNGRRTSAFGSAFTSPRVALARDQSSISEPGNDTLMRDPPAVPEGANLNGNGHSRTYESFWRSQAQRTLTSPSNSQQAHLAPPVDVGSAMRPNGYLRRSSSNERQQRSGLSQSTSDQSTSGRYFASSVPNLPHAPGQKEDMATRITTALINDRSGPSPRSAQNGNGAITNTPRDPAQARNKKTQSMQEQDAIETLLFMSSPGGHANPLNFPPPSQTPSSQSQSQVPQGSPLETSLSQETKQELNSPDQPPHIRLPPGQSSFYGPDGQFYSNVPDEKLYGASSDWHARRRDMEKRRRSGGRLTGEEIERLIDSYKGESSDEEVEIPLPMPKQRPQRTKKDAHQGEVESAQVEGRGGEERQRQVTSRQAERQRVALPTGAGNG